MKELANFFATSGKGVKASVDMWSVTESSNIITELLKELRVVENIIMVRVNHSRVDLNKWIITSYTNRNS